MEAAVLALLASLAALATEPPAFELSTLARVEIADPWSRARGVGLRGAWRAGEHLSIEARGAWFPDFGEASWTPLAHQLVEENRVSPDMTVPLGSAALMAAYEIAHGELGPRAAPFGLELVFGTGLLWTGEQILGHMERHPEHGGPRSTLVYGVAASAWPSKIGVRAEAHRTSFIDRIDGVHLEVRHLTFVGAGLTFALSRSRPGPTADDLPRYRGGVER